MRKAIRPVDSIAHLLKRRRKELALSLREVEKQTGVLGEPIAYTVIARIERGEVDPGIRRLSVLLRLYDVPLQVATELAEAEQFAEHLPKHETADYEDAIQTWKRGDLKKAVGKLFALRAKQGETAKQRYERQRGLVMFAIAMGSMGKYRLSRHVIDELLLEPIDPKLLVSAFVQSSACWHGLGSSEMALALLDRADVHVSKRQPKERAWVSHSRATTLVSMGQFENAEREIRRALAAYRSARDTYGECKAHGVLVRLNIDRGELKTALRDVRRARKRAKELGHDRLDLMRQIDEGRILLALDDPNQGASVLHAALGTAGSNQDGICQFHAHFYLWKAYETMSQPERAEFELTAAQYHIRFLDDTTPESQEIRTTMTSKAADAIASDQAFG